MLLSKPIRSPRAQNDGTRISVMNRHTLNDGITPDVTIKPEMYDLWRPELSAPSNLLGDYYKRGLSWVDFEFAYLDYLSNPDIKPVLSELAHTAMRTNITILCTEDSPQKCHRRLIVESCGLILPDLDVNIG